MDTKRRRGGHSFLGGQEGKTGLGRGSGEREKEGKGVARCVKYRVSYRSRPIGISEWGRGARSETNEAKAIVCLVLALG